MHVRYFRAATLATSVAIALLAMGCSQMSKTAQCKRLIETINEGVTLASDFEAENRNFLASQPKTPAAAAEVVNQAAGVVDQLVTDLGVVGQKLADIQLKDENLIEFRQQYAASLQTFSQSLGKGAKGLRNMGQLLESIQAVKPDQIPPEKAKTLTAEMRAAEKDIRAAGSTSQQTGQEVDKIASEINDYCAVTPAETTQE